MEMASKSKASMFSTGSVTNRLCCTPISAGPELALPRLYKMLSNLLVLQLSAKHQ